MLQEVVNYIKQNSIDIGIILVIVCSVVQVAPIEINPWSWILRSIGNLLLGDIKEELKELTIKVDSINFKVQQNEKEGDMRRIRDLRRDILNFAHTLKNGAKYGENSFEHIYEEHKEYEELLKKYGMTNGQTTSAMETIDEHYKECKG